MSTRISTTAASLMYVFLFGDRNRKETRDGDQQEYARRLEEFNDLIELALANTPLPTNASGGKLQTAIEKMSQLRCADQFDALTALRALIGQTLDDLSAAA